MGVEPEKVSFNAYFNVSYDRIGVPIQIHYFNTTGGLVAKMVFDEFDEGKLSKLPKLYSVILRTGERRPEEFYPREEESLNPTKRDDRAAIPAAVYLE